MRTCIFFVSLMLKAGLLPTLVYAFSLRYCIYLSFFFLVRFNNTAGHRGFTEEEKFYIIQRTMCITVYFILSCILILVYFLFVLFQRISEKRGRASMLRSAGVSEKHGVVPGSVEGTPATRLLLIFIFFLTTKTTALLTAS